MPYGDCFVVEWIDQGGKKHCIVLDGGTSRSYRDYTRAILTTIESIDLWVVSHCHEDHIGGVLKYLEDVESGLLKTRCHRWLYNSHRQGIVLLDDVSTDGTKAESVRQFDLLLSLLKRSGVDVQSIGGTALDTIEIGDMKITIMSPDVDELNTFRNSALPHEADTVAVSSVASDYGRRVDSFDIEHFKEDENLVNRSCLSLLLELGTKSFLWLSDSIPSSVCKSMWQLGYTEEHPLQCDLVTLAHHGSSGNNNVDLMRCIYCDTYFVTSDACNKHKLPNKEVLSRILRTKREDDGRQLKFLFACNNTEISQIFNVDGEDELKTYNFKVEQGVTCLEL